MKKLILSILFEVAAIVTFAQGPWDRHFNATGTGVYTGAIMIPTYTTYSSTTIYPRFSSTNSGAASININSLGVVPIRAWDGDSWEVLTGGEIKTGVTYELSYNGSYFELAGGPPGAGGGAVSSVFGRTGAVVKASGDYTASDITTLPTGEMTGTHAQQQLYNLYGFVTNNSWKTSVRVATTTTGTLATAYNTGDIVDGVTLVSGDRILIKNQSTQSENGIYAVVPAGAPIRAYDANSTVLLENATVTVNLGTTNANTTWFQETNSPTVGSSNIVFTTFGGSSDGNITTRNRLEPNEETASYTLTLADTSKLNILNNVADLVITLDDFSVFNHGTQWVFYRKSGTDTVYFDDGGETLEALSLGVTEGTYAYLYYNPDDNEFYLASGGGSGGTSGAGLVDGDYIDITVGGVGTTMTIDNNAVTNAKINDVALGKVSGLGTGIATALAINTGSAGAPVLFNGAGGTPSSLTGTNITGIPESGVTNLVSDLALKAPLASPTFTGVPIVPTASANTNNTQAASTAYADAKVTDGTITNGTTTTAPSQDDVFDALALKKDAAITAASLTDGGSITITAAKHTLTTDEATITFSDSYTGDFTNIDVTFSTTAATWTFPSGSLCVVEGSETGNNVATVTGTSGDIIVISIWFVSSGNYRIAIKNFGQ